jgi:hypothetical protein
MTKYLLALLLLSVSLLPHTSVAQEQLYTNNATTTLAASLTVSQTQMTVASAAQFPTSLTGGNWFVVTLQEISSGIVTAQEIVKVTAVNGATWTIVRAQENTVAQPWATGNTVALLPTAGGFANFAQLANLTPLAPLASPALTGVPTAPTAAAGTNTTQIATTANVIANVAPLAPRASPAFTGVPTAPTAATDTNTTQIATTANVVADIATAVAPLAPLASPALTGVPTAPTAATGTNNAQIATTANVVATASAIAASAVAPLAPLASPAFSGDPTAPTAALGSSTAQIANTAFVMNAVNPNSRMLGTGFQEFESGLVIEWGSSICAPGGTSIAIPLTLATIFNVQLTTGGEGATVSVLSIGSGGGTFVCTNGSGEATFWVVIGVI